MLTIGLSSRRARWFAAAVAAVVALVSSACSGSSHHATTAKSATAAPEVATRWWSNPAATQGSRIDESNPQAAAAQLVQSTSTYCDMLKQTLSAGRTILPGAHAGDKALVASTEAFLAELEGVAPTSVVGQWQALAPTLVALVSGKQLPANTSVQAKRNLAAVKAVNADAKANCGLDLSSK